MGRFKKATAGVAMLALFAVGGQMDIEDEQAQADHCAEMVKGGNWPEQVCK